MKQLDWKSFAIGIFLTTTVVFGVAATNPTAEKQWDENQKWLVEHFPINVKPTKEEVEQKREDLVGWEFVGVSDNKLTYRKPVLQWPELPSYTIFFKDVRARDYQRSKDLNFIYP